ncbi:MAG: hypothetical protein HC846_00115 [Blastocatellia bacterium]|nr:hypothetical protein [Blastocatellia bacterium]
MMKGIFRQKLNEFIVKRKRVAIDCRQGIGRSSLIAACVLILQNESVENSLRKFQGQGVTKFPLHRNKLTE